jgi:hypothetical protein
MMGAGHPRMSFELETFAQTQPPHFVIDAEWQKRKREWDGVRVWAIGQALAAGEILDVLLDPKRSRDGLFPELVVFDCHACHHPMSDLRWTPRHGIGPGRIRLNDANFLMLRQIARVALPPADARELEGRVTRLHRAVGGRGRRRARGGEDAARRARSGRGADRQASLHRRGPARHVAWPRRGRHRRRVSRLRGRGAGDDGVGTLLEFLSKRGEVKDVRAANAALDVLHQTVREDEKFQPARFQQALARLRDNVLR